MIDLIIIGGGAAGSFLASLLPSAHLFERKDMLMSKLLITGGGACNLTHECDAKTAVTMYHDRKAFVSPCLYSFTPSDIREYFLSLGVRTTVREDGKVFPASMDSRTVASALTSRIKNVHLSEAVTDIERNDGYFTVTTEKGTYRASKVAVATGGASYPATGSDGSFFAILKKLGHTIVPLRPALSALKTDLDTSSLQGITVENVTLSHGKRKYTGPVLFTARGISGPMVMDLSHDITPGDVITLSFSDISAADIKSCNGKKEAVNAVHELTLLPKALLQVLIKQKDKKIAELTKKDLQEITSAITSLKLTVRPDDLKYATVTSGGVDTSEINRETFESRIVKGLYIIGECTDVDGKCGGFNLTYAFAGAHAVYRSLSK